MNKYIFICLYIESLNFIGLLFSLEADKIFLETEIVRAQSAFQANSKDIDISLPKRPREVHECPDLFCLRGAEPRQPITRDCFLCILLQRTVQWVLLEAVNCRGINLFCTQCRPLQQPGIEASSFFVGPLVVLKCETTRNEARLGRTYTREEKAQTHYAAGWFLFYFWAISQVALFLAGNWREFYFQLPEIPLLEYYVCCR